MPAGVTALLVIDAQESFRHHPYWTDSDVPLFVARLTNVATVRSSPAASTSGSSNTASAASSFPASAPNSAVRLPRGMLRTLATKSTMSPALHSPFR